MVPIRGGSFSMGSFRFPDTQPSHTRVLTRSIAVARSPLSIGEWNELVPDQAIVVTGRPGARAEPAQVQYDRAVELAEHLTRRTGKAYRLITEGEFEYAAGGGTNGLYFWGPQPITSGAIPDQRHPFGLRGMAGGVNQWTTDDYSGYLAAVLQGTPDASTPVTLPNLLNNFGKVVRGEYQEVVRRAYRSRFGTAGVRLVRELE
jgi:formylglycine-generating enzyme required for sulfatase activity